MSYSSFTWSIYAQVFSLDKVSNTTANVMLVQYAGLILKKSDIFTHLSKNLDQDWEARQALKPTFLVARQCNYIIHNLFLFPIDHTIQTG